MKSFIMGRWWESWWEGMGRMVRRVRTRDDEENHLDYSGTSCASDYLCVVHQSYRRCYGRAWHGPMKERSKLWNCLLIHDIALGKVTGIQQILVTWYPICWPGFQKIQRSMSLAYSTKTSPLFNDSWWENCSFGSGDFIWKNWSSQQTWQPYILFFFLLWISCSSSSEKLSQEVSNVVSRDLKGRSLKMITVLLTKDLWQASAGDLIYTK